jgi:hypothetical protein
MLMNEFDLETDTNEPVKNQSFYWKLIRNIVVKGKNTDMSIVLLMKRHKKGFYELSPNLTIVIK